MKTTTIFPIVAFAAIVNSTAVAQYDTKEDKKERTNMNQSREDKGMNRMYSDGDRRFVIDAAGGGMLEAMIGKLASTNASSQEVKSLGSTLVADHEKANTELKMMAQKKGIVIPTALNDKNQRKYDDLSKKRGTEFDKDFVDFVKKDHKKDIDMFEKQAEKGDDAEIKSWARGKIPTLRRHLEMAETCERNMGMSLKTK